MVQEVGCAGITTATSNQVSLLDSVGVSDDQAIPAILKHDNKTTSYSIALLRALNDLVLSYPGLVQREQSVAVPLARIAELWAAYYWLFMGPQPMYQDSHPLFQGTMRNDVSFRPALTQLRAEWQRTLLTTAEPADGFFLFTEMRTPRRRATYPALLARAYDQAITAIAAIRKPIQYAGPEQWSLFPQPEPFGRLAGAARSWRNSGAVAGSNSAPRAAATGARASFCHL
jgi:hypothetical protein